MSKAEARTDRSQAGAEASFDLPHRRGSFLLNTPALVDHHVFWHHGKTEPYTYGEFERGDAVTIPEFLLKLGFHVSDPDQKPKERPLLGWNAVADPKSGKHSWSIDARAIVAGRINQLLDLTETKIETQNGVKGRSPRFTSDYGLCKASDRLWRDYAKQTKAPPQIPDCLFLNRTVGHAGRVGTVLFEILCDIHAEYFSVMIRAYPGADAPAISGAAAEEAAFAAARLALQGLLQAPRATAQPEASSQDNGAIEAVYDAFWDEFYKGLLGSDKKDSIYSFFDEIAYHCASFRGIALRPMEAVDQDNCLNKLDTFDNKNDSLGTVQISDRSKVVRPIPKNHFDMFNPYESGDDKPSKDTLDLYAQTASKLVQQVNTHTSFFGRMLGFHEGDQWIDQTRPSNAVFCSFLDGLAVYGSDLGAHPTQSAEGNRSTRKQIRFFLIYAGPSRDQLGRLLRRLLYCGELRIVPLLDFSELRAAGKRISRISEALEELELKILNAAGEIKTKTVADGEEAAVSSDLPQEDGADAVNLARNHALPRLDQRIAEAMRAGEGGLKHRISRCLLYYSLLKKTMNSLRVSRIDAWQPYDDFINSRVQPPFLSLEALSSDIEVLLATRRRIEERLASLEIRAATLKLSELVADTNALQGTMTELQQDINETADRTRKQTEQLVNLQYTAELVGMIILIISSVPIIFALSSLLIYYTASPIFNIYTPMFSFGWSLALSVLFWVGIFLGASWLFKAWRRHRALTSSSD